MKDIEILLRGFAMLLQGDTYKASMVKFLNAFSKNAESFGPSRVSYLESLFESFLVSASNLSQDAFYTTSNRFSMALFDAVFAAVCREAYAHETVITGKIVPSSVSELKADAAFGKAAESRPTDRANVMTRLDRARATLQVQ